MQQLTHASQTFTTTDEVSTALLDLVASLRGDDHSMAVAVPVLTHEGEVIELTMTMNTSSAFVIVPIDSTSAGEQMITTASAAAVRALRSRTGSSASHGE